MNNSKLLSSEEIQMMLVLDDRKEISCQALVKNTPVVDLPTTASLIDAGMVEQVGESIKLTNAGGRVINATRSKLSFSKMLKTLPFVALTKLVDTVVKHAMKVGFHLNVPFTGLPDEEFEYLEKQVQQAKEKRQK